MLLAIDTSAGTSVAVVDRVGGVLSEQSSADTRLHAEVIGTLISAALEEADVSVESLSAVAAGMGPGPFTGLRVGIAAAQAFALAIARPVVRVVSHDAIAYAYFADRRSHAGASTASDATAPLLVVTDARRREVYWSAYEGVATSGIPLRVTGPGVARPDDLGAEIAGLERYRRVDADVVSAAALGMLAETMYMEGVPFAGAEPLYLRSPDVTLSALPKRVS